MLRKNLTTFTAVILMIAVISAGVLTYGTNAAFADGTEKTTEEILEDNGLPVVYINIDDEEFDKVNESDDHSYRCETGTVTITVPDGYKGDYSEEVLSDMEGLEIEYFRGRGNRQAVSFFPFSSKTCRCSTTGSHFIWQTGWGSDIRQRDYRWTSW